MGTIVDARGLSCPQPVLITMDAIRAGAEKELDVLVDTDTSVENVTRAAASQGWTVINVAEEESCFKVTIRKE